MKNKKNILIVDDDIHLQNAIKHALVKEGYDVTTAAGIESCRQRLISSIPDLMLLDVVLPDGNGIDFIKELYRNELYSSVGIMLMSGLKTDKPFVQEGLDSGALYFSRKPFEIKELLQRIALIFKVKELEKNKLQLEERFNHFFTNASDIFFVLNSQGKILNISKSYEDICGITLSNFSNKNFNELVPKESKDAWDKNLKKIVSGGILPSFEIYLTNIYNNLIPVDVQLTKSVTKDKKESVIIGIAKDLRVLKQLELEQKESEIRTQDKSRELSTWESLTVQNTRLTEISYEVSALSDETSEVFLNMLEAYRELVNLAIQQRIYKTDTDNSLKIRMFANELGFLKAAPKDLIRIHTTFYKTLSGKINAKKVAIYHEEARLILLTTMGYLVSFYRNRNIKAYE